jgi:molybdenum cofactor biosynthesis enzyme MoaA
MMIFVIEDCNFVCPHCVREDEPMEPGYRLTFEQLQRCLDDCRTLRSVSWVHFSGGETTLWSDGERDLVDLLLEIADAGYVPGFTSNGSLFDSYNACEDFFRRYLDGSTTPLRLYLSVDTFHNNFDTATGRAQCLDNLVEFRRHVSREQQALLPITVAATVSKDLRSLLPDNMVKHYERVGVEFAFLPMMPIGKGSRMRHLCPDIESDDAADLGAFELVSSPESRRERARKLRRGGTGLILIGDTYWDRTAEEGDSEHGPWRQVGRLGQLPSEIIQAYAGHADR